MAGEGPNHHSGLFRSGQQHASRVTRELLQLRAKPVGAAPLSTSKPPPTLSATVVNCYASPPKHHKPPPARVRGVARSLHPRQLMTTRRTPPTAVFAAVRPLLSAAGRGDGGGYGDDGGGREAVLGAPAVEEEGGDEAGGLGLWWWWRVVVVVVVELGCLSIRMWGACHVGRRATKSACAGPRSVGGGANPNAPGSV